MSSFLYARLPSSSKIGLALSAGPKFGKVRIRCSRWDLSLETLFKLVEVRYFQLCCSQILLGFKGFGLLDFMESFRFECLLAWLGYFISLDLLVHLLLLCFSFVAVLSFTIVKNLSCWLFLLELQLFSFLVL